ncbi:unnamed protein product [Symbiodinium sp. CCMP2456]|nr:unnamed protein product [Symbiodinium sp. CCMP2456]
MGVSLQLTRRSARGNRFKMKLAWTQFLQAAYSRICRNAAVALRLDVAKSTVRRMQIMVSSTFMNRQAHFLAKLAQWCLNDRPAAVIKHIKWDETQLQCSMNADKSDYRVRSTWQVLVCRMLIMIVWPSGCNLVYRIIMPPVTLLATGAEHQYYALYHHPAYKCINGLVGYMRQQAKINIDVSETDGAASNLRLLAHLVQKAKATVLGPPDSSHPLLPAHCRCMNHGVQLNNASLLAVVNSKLLNRVYALSIFLRNLGYWLRMRQAARTWLERNLKFERSKTTESPPEAHPCLKELLNYLSFWRTRDQVARAVEGDGGQQQHSELEESTSEASFARKISYFAEMFNGPSMNGAPMHVCSSSCAAPGQRHCKDRNDAVRKCVDALLGLFLRGMPAVPSPSKWSKLFGPLDFVFAGSLVHNWLSEIFCEAFGDMSFQEFAEDAATEDVDPRLVETLAFHVVNGRRLLSSRKFLQDRDSAWQVSLLFVALEPNRLLTWFWIGCLKKSWSPEARPPLFSLLDPKDSVLTGALQHFSSLLCTTEGGGRMQFLWKPLGYQSFDDFCQLEPGLVRQIRRVLLFAAGWQFRHHYDYIINCDTYAIGLVADPNACPDEPDRFLRGWERKKTCCVQPGLCRGLKLRNVSGDELQSASWKQVLYWYAACFQFTIADVEVKHAQNRQNTDSGFSTVAAKFINSEAMLENRQARQHVNKGKGKATDTSFRRIDSDVRLSDNRSSRPRGKSAFEVYRANWIQNQRLQNDAFNPCTKTAWDEVRRGWANLDEQQQSIYKAMSLASKQSAQDGRRRAAASAAAPASRLGNGPGLDQEPSQESQALQPLPQLGPSTPSLVGILPLDKALASETVKDLQSKIRAASSGKGAASVGKHTYPVSEQMLETIACHQRKRGVSSAAAVAQFDLEMERIARPPADAEVFPKKVCYESCCGYQCRNSGEHDRISLHCKLVEAARADLLCAFTVIDAAKRNIVREYAWVTAPSARSGVHKPDQVFVCADDVTSSFGSARDRPAAVANAFAGLRLMLSTVPYVECKREWLPSTGDAGQPVGRLRMYTTDAFAFYLLGLLTSPEDLTPRTPGEVVVDRLAFEDEQAAEPGGAIGVDDGDASLPAVGEGDADNSAADSADIFDFMSFLGDPNKATTTFASRSPPGAKRRKTETGRGRAGKGKPADNINPDAQHEFEEQPAHETDFLDILDDPELRSVLDDNAIQALRQAAAMCHHVHRPEEVLQAAHAQHSLESDDDEILEFATEDAAEADNDGGSSAAPAASSTSPTPASAGTSSSSSSAARTDSVRLESDGGRIEAVYTGQGTSYCKVIRRVSNTSEELAQISLLVNASTGAESLRAVCKKHKSCTCFVSSAAHCDLLMDWLASAHLESAEQHGRLSVELRRSIGMRVQVRAKR